MKTHTHARARTHTHAHAHARTHTHTLVPFLEWNVHRILLGGSKSNEQWLWDNGEPIKMDLFAAGQPDSSGTCFAMVGKFANYGYDDWACVFSTRYACERNY